MYIVDNEKKGKLWIMILGTDHPIVNAHLPLILNHY